MKHIDMMVLLKDAKAAIEKVEQELSLSEPKEELQKAREFWVDLLQRNFVIDEKPSEKTISSYVHVREVLPNTVTITKDQLAKAWEESDRRFTDGYAPAHSSETFKEICRALGFESGDV